MLTEAVEKRFGDINDIPEAHALEFLSDNGGAYIAAESFVNTFKRDSVCRMDLADASTVMAPLRMSWHS